MLHNLVVVVSIYADVRIMREAASMTSIISAMSDGWASLMLIRSLPTHQFLKPHC